MVFDGTYNFRILSGNLRCDDHVEMIRQYHDGIYGVVVYLFACTETVA